MCVPKEFGGGGGGGVGVANLQNLVWALRLRCLWLQKVDPSRPWAAFSDSVPPLHSGFFSLCQS